MLGTGREYPRDEIPWWQVGAGWTVALAVPLTDKTNVPSVHQIIYLVDPDGSRYKIADHRGEPLYLDDVSGDHRRAVLTQSVKPDSTAIIQLDLASGVMTRFVVAHLDVDVEYTKPMGRALVMVSTGATDRQVLRRVALDGSVQEIYDPRIFGKPFVMTLPLYASDGVTFVLATHSGFVVLQNDGTFVRRILFPSGYTCLHTRRWWSPDVFVARCSAIPTKAANGNWVNSKHPEALWLMSVDGTARSQIKVNGNDLAAGIGLINAWPTDGGIWAEEATGCGPPIVDRVDSDGSVHRVEYSMPGLHQAVIEGATNSNLYLVGYVGCNSQPTTALVKMNAQTGMTTMLLGPRLGNVYVWNVRTIEQ